MRHPLRSTATLGVGGLASLIAVTAGQCAPSTGPSRAEPGWSVPTVATVSPDLHDGAGRAATPPDDHHAPSTTTILHRPPSGVDASATTPLTTTAATHHATTTVAATPTPAPTAAPAVPTSDVSAAPPEAIEVPVPPSDPPPPTEPAPSAPVEPSTTPAPPPPGSTSEAVVLANERRVAAGVAPLAADDALSEAARSHSIDQATMQSATHTGSDGSSPADRVAQSGFHAVTLAENVAAGYGTPAAVIDGWMGSMPHRDNLLDPAFTSIGVASAQAGDGTLYWTMVLAG